MTRIRPSGWPVEGWWPDAIAHRLEARIGSARAPLVRSTRNGCDTDGLNG